MASSEWKCFDIMAGHTTAKHPMNAGGLKGEQTKYIILLLFCLYIFCVSWLEAPPSETDAALRATAGASDYAVRPNQFPVFGLMDAIIFMDLKQVSVPHPTPAQPDTHMHTLIKASSPTRWTEWSVKDNQIYVIMFSIC